MFERLKHALVGSYVGAIALGWLFAQGVIQFVNIFAAPVASWIARTECGKLTGDAAGSARFWPQEAVPELVRFFLVLLVWYILLRWLYFKPLKKQTLNPTNPDLVA